MEDVSKIKEDESVLTHSKGKKSRAVLTIFFILFIFLTFYSSTENDYKIIDMHFQNAKAPVSYDHVFLILYILSNI